MLDQLSYTDTEKGVKLRNCIFNACLVWASRIDSGSKGGNRLIGQLLKVVSCAACRAIPESPKNVIEGTTRFASEFVLLTFFRVVKRGLLCVLANVIRHSIHVNDVVAVSIRVECFCHLGTELCNV